MTEPKLTNEFSICIMTDEVAAADVQKVRDRLAKSPYRDDTPHVTLLRGITTPSEMSDQELVDKLLQILPDMNKVTAKVARVTNAPDMFYKKVSVIFLSAPKVLREYRKQVIKRLQENDFKVQAYETVVYFPHVTLRLGVPISGDDKKFAKALFPKDRQITFDRWVVFRLIKKDGKRYIREIPLMPGK